VDRRRRKDAAPRRPRRRVRGRAAECGRYRRRDRRRRRSDPVGRRDPHRRGAIGLLERGVDRVILGTAAVENPDIVAEISESYPDSVVVSLDAKDGEVVVEGWTEGAGISPVGPHSGTTTSEPPRSSLRTSTSRANSRAWRPIPSANWSTRPTSRHRQRRRRDARGRPSARRDRCGGGRRRQRAVRGELHARRSAGCDRCRVARRSEPVGSSSDSTGTVQ